MRLTLARTTAGGECLTDFSTCAHTGFQGCERPGALCCLDAAFAECERGAGFPIKASNYDQSCTQDSDCIGIGEGNGCDCGVSCPTAAINVKDYDRWQKDLKKAPVRATVCHCPATHRPCCVDHHCKADFASCEPQVLGADGGKEVDGGKGTNAGIPAGIAACGAAGGKCLFEARYCTRVGPQDCSGAGICCLD